MKLENEPAGADSDSKGPHRLIKPVGDFVDKLRSALLRKVRDASAQQVEAQAPSRSDLFKSAVKRTRVKLMGQLLPIADRLENEARIEYNFEIPDHSSLLDQTNRKTLVREILFRAIARTRGLLDGSVPVERLEINVISIGSEYGFSKSARIRYKIFMRDGEPPHESENVNIINLGN